MPSWNIHTAHAEALLGSFSPRELGICDIDSFLFGNLAPDIYVGYMVEPISHKIDYHTTHLAEPQFMPEPAAEQFWARYLPKRWSADAALDMALGAWAHLLCDRYYNRRARKVALDAGYAPGDTVRILKQSDFDVFGRSLRISRAPEPTESLLAQAAAFPQYPIEKNDVFAALAAERAIIEHNAEHPAPVPAPYQLLSAEFFSATFDFCNERIARRLRAFAVGETFEFYD